MKKRRATSPNKKRKKRGYAPGWNENRVKDVIAYYDKQTEDEELAEYEAAMQVKGQSMIFVPTELVPEIHRLIARRRA
jgi:hypothetical protein